LPIDASDLCRGIESLFPSLGNPPDSLFRENALEKRLDSYAQTWLADSEYRDALHRYDWEHHDTPELKRAAG
jgi:hypothetical protein